MPGTAHHFARAGGPATSLLVSPDRMWPQPPASRDARRVQLSRQWRGAALGSVIYMGRSSLWANPFARRNWGHARGVLYHRHWLLGDLGALTLEKMGFSPGEIAALERRLFTVIRKLPDLQGKDLGCWCSLKSPWCHVDTYLALLRGHIKSRFPCAHRAACGALNPIT